MTQADKIRLFVMNNYFKIAREDHLTAIIIRAGDIHKKLGLSAAMPSVCSALGGAKLAQLANVTLINRTGPKLGANVYFTFQLSPDPSASIRHLKHPKPNHKDTANVPNISAYFDISDALVLVGCAKQKRSHASPARDIYTSTQFTSARSLIEAQGALWRILSAKHGLLSPDCTIEPYDLSLNNMGTAERKIWAKTVFSNLVPLLQNTKRVVFLAGLKYREFLLEPIHNQGIEVVTPMAHLRQGQQISWLQHQAKLANQI